MLSIKHIVHSGCHVGLGVGVTAAGTARDGGSEEVMVNAAAVRVMSSGRTRHPHPTQPPEVRRHACPE